MSHDSACVLRGTTDYWVNDIQSPPFFKVERPIDHGLLEALRSDIVPRLLKDVPSPADRGGTRGRSLSRTLVILFDREGYSPEFFKEMWQTHRIACITYHSIPSDDWAGRRVRGDRNDVAGRRAGLAPTCRAGELDRRPQERACGCGRSQADHQWASGQPDQHAFGGSAVRTRLVCSGRWSRKTSSAT